MGKNQGTQTSRSFLRWEKIVIHYGLHFFFFLNLIACGDESSSYLKDGPFPSLNNLHEWIHLWDKKSWIGFRYQDYKEGEILNQIIHQVTRQRPSQRLTLQSWFQQHPIETIRSNHNPHYQIHIFSLPQEIFVQALPYSVVHPQFFWNLATEQWSLLQNSRIWDWIEPDLGQPLNIAPWIEQKSKDQEDLYEHPQNNTNPNNTGSSSTLLDKIPTDYKNRVEQILTRIRIKEARTIENTTKAEVHIAVLDTGVDALHPYLINKMFIDPNHPNPKDPLRHGFNATIDENLPGQNPGSGPVSLSGNACLRSYDINDPRAEDCLHGTHVAGIIAADFGLGICDYCKIISIRVSNRIPILDKSGRYLYSVDGSIQDSSQIRALNYLYNLRNPKNHQNLIVNAINFSLGKSFFSRTIAFLISLLKQYDIVLFAAAGNENVQNPMYPAAHNDVVGVAALGESEALKYRGIYGKATFSNFGTWIDISAPGTRIASTVPGMRNGVGLYEKMSGTSMASPIAIGTFGFLKSYFGNKLSSQEIVQLMLKGANYQKVYQARFNQNLYRQVLPGQQVVTMLGAGIVDAFASIKKITQSEFDRNVDRQTTTGCVLSQIGTHKGFLKSDQMFVVILWIVTFFVSLGKRHRNKSSKI